MTARALRHPRVKTLDKRLDFTVVVSNRLSVLSFIRKDALWAVSGPKTSFRGKKEFCRMKYLRRVQKYKSWNLKKCTEEGRRGLRVSSEYSRKCKRRIVMRRLEAIAHKEARSGIGSHRNGMCSNFTLHASFFLRHTHRHTRTQSVVGHSPLHCILDYLRQNPDGMKRRSST